MGIIGIFYPCCHIADRIKRQLSAWCGPWISSDHESKYNFFFFILSGSTLSTMGCCMGGVTKTGCGGQVGIQKVVLFWKIAAPYNSMVWTQTFILFSTVTWYAHSVLLKLIVLIFLGWEPKKTNALFGFRWENGSLARFWQLPCNFYFLGYYLHWRKHPPPHTPKKRAHTPSVGMQSTVSAAVQLWDVLWPS